MSKLVRINLFGDLGDSMGRHEWNLDVKSPLEALHAINVMTNNKLTDYFLKDKVYTKYRILINGRDFYAPTKEINERNWETITQSELVMEKKDLKSIDVVPVLESAAIGTIITLVIAIILAVAVYLLTKPPSFDAFRAPDKSTGQSYLFGGPINTVGEGGPVPIGYGRVLIGSQVISSAYQVVNYQTSAT